MTYNTNTLEQFIVNRDGQLDEEWLESHLADIKRLERLQMAHKAIEATSRSVTQAGRYVGRQLVRGAYTYLDAIDQAV